MRNFDGIIRISRIAQPIAKKSIAWASIAAMVFSAVLFVAPRASVEADVNNISFESPTYTIGNINGQDGWSKTGPYDSEVDSSLGTDGFGDQSLRISNAVTSGSFGDQTFAKPVTNAAGEVDSTDGTFSRGTLQSHFETQFDIASTKPNEQQPGLSISVSPDRGDGSRLSYLRFEDGATGINVFFDDVQGTSNPANFVETQIATDLDRTTPHNVKLSIDFVDGPSNDVVEVSIDGALVHTGTTWENYYRYDSESAAEQSPRIVKTVLFRAGGTAAPDTSGNGFLFDNLTLQSSGTPASSTVVVKPSDMNGWYFYDDNTDSVQSDTADHGMVTGPATPPIGVGSAHLTKTTNDKYGIATTQFQGTSLNEIGTLEYSTYRASGTSAQVPSLGFDVDSDTTDADTSYQGRLTYEPYFTHTVDTGVWQTWDTQDNAGTGNWWFSHATLSGGAASVCVQANPCTWSELTAAYPNAAMISYGQFILRTNGADGEAFDGNVDNLIIGISNNTTTFDFEPESAPTSPEVHIFKYVDGVAATAENANSSSFPMLTTFNSSVYGSVTDAPFTLSPTGWGPTDGPYEASYVGGAAGDDYSAHEVTTGDVVGASCADNKPFALVGYTTGDTLEEAAAATPSTTEPSFTDLQTDKYVIVWNQVCNVSTVTVTIDKFVDGAMATATSANNSSFTMSATWDAVNIGAGTGTYSLGPVGYNSPNPYEAITAEMTSGADYSTYEVMDGTVVGATCGTTPYTLLGYTVGDTFEEAAAATPSMTVPSFTNLTQNKFVIVWNKTCECPAAPSVAAQLLKLHNVKPGSSAYKNYISQVAQHMGPQTDFNNVSACNTAAYQDAVDAYLKSLGAYL